MEMNSKNNKLSSERSNSLDIDEYAFQNLRITAKEKQDLLNKLENEMNVRIQKLKQQAEEFAKELSACCEREINNLPKEIRQLPLDEFINLYHADPAEYFERCIQ
ncbi:9849_t:CDS:2 [Funneliformis geosporum]|uniref:16153_t:CDS:1 n=1 Tax=Funneliformis geosporum TaxID=1117311 RepID=A0A9W4ST83_9GLOM|nr:16153_t:CDS:2 [Funneliformis geosporum]CAI2181821.1 9849_t:CDS:2 [Funneliformis geosporum]